jgi:hypothetical protein
MFLGSKARPVLRADRLKCDSLVMERTSRENHVTDNFECRIQMHMGLP